MARLIAAVFLLQILLAWFELCALQTTLTHLRSVQVGENVTLSCDIIADYEFSWFHHVSEEMQLLVSFSRAKLNKELSLSYTLDDNHYDVVENKTTRKVSLMIVNVSKTDLGMYYCAGRNHTTFTQFSKAVRLISADESSSDGSKSELLETGDSKWQRLWILMLSLMCVSFVSILINIISISVCCCYRRQSDVKSVSLSTCCSRSSIDSSLTKEASLHYSTFGCQPDGRNSSDRDTASMSDSVTYARVNSRAV